MRDGDFLDSGRRSTDTVQYLRKIERELGKAEMDVVSLRMAWREADMRANNLAHQLYAAQQTIKALIDEPKQAMFYEITREKI